MQRLGVGSAVSYFYLFFLGLAGALIPCVSLTALTLIDHSTGTSQRKMRDCSCSQSMAAIKASCWLAMTALSH